MSVVLAGNAANVTSPLSATITAMANNGSGLVRVSTLSAHFFGDQDNVVMQTTVPSVNGTWRISVIDASHFDLQGSSFAATGTGTVIDQSLTPQVLCPSDGDPFSAQLSGLLSAFQACLDRTQYLQSQLTSTSSARSLSALAMVAQNWGPSVVWPETNGPGPMSACSAISNSVDLGQMWHVFGLDAARTDVVDHQFDGQAYLGGVQFTPPSGPQFLSCAADTSGNVYVALSAGGTSWLVYRSAGGGGYLLFSTITSSLTTIAIDIAILNGTTIVYAAESGFAGSSQLGVVGAASGLTGITLQFLPICRAGGGVAIVTDHTSPGTNIYRSTNGSVWTTATVSSSFGASATIADLSWNGIAGLWMAVGNNGTSATAWTSPDGITWTIAATLTTLTTHFTSIAPFGSGWVAGLTFGGEGTIVYSPDAKTWYHSDATWQTGGSTNASFRVLASANANQLMGVMTNTNTPITPPPSVQFPVRLSLAIGNPNRQVF